jgi:REP element-mobilizing transposase RayT
VRERLKYQREQLSAVKQSGRQLLPFESVLDFRLSRKRIEELLDAGSGSCLFKRPDLAKIVADALRFWDGKRCDMYAWCVMPNHVHAVFRTIPPVTLTTLFSSWKSFTVHRINLKLDRFGRIWQPEYYDHLIRNELERQRAIRYVQENPIKAGLVNWPWVFVKES